MEYLVYRSTALVSRSSHAFHDILSRARDDNARMGITGFLHCEADMFLQYIEGPSDALHGLYERIRRDRRHANPEVLCRGALTSRRFAGWRMGWSSVEVLSFRRFCAGMSYGVAAGQDMGRTAVAFLMTASQRMDLGLVEAPALGGVYERTA